MGDPRFLLLDEDSTVGCAISRIMRLYGEPVIAGTMGEARRLLTDGGDWCGFTLDTALPDGSGLDFLARVRKTYPLTPALVVTRHVGADLINRAFDLHAEYVVKPDIARRVERFAREAVSVLSHASVPARVERVIQASARTCGLTEAEIDVLRRSALGQDRIEIAAARGSSALTVKTQITRMLCKTGHGSLAAAIGWMLREVARTAD